MKVAVHALNILESCSMLEDFVKNEIWTLTQSQKLFQDVRIVQYHVYNFRDFYPTNVGQLTHPSHDQNEHLERGSFTTLGGPTMDGPIHNVET